MRASGVPAQCVRCWLIRKEYELSQLWADAAIKARHASKDLAVRLNDKSAYWSEKLKWSREEVLARLLGVVSVCIGTAPIGFLYLGFLAAMFTPRTATVALALQGVLAMLVTRRYWVGVLRP